MDYDLTNRNQITIWTSSIFHVYCLLFTKTVGLYLELTWLGLLVVMIHLFFWRVKCVNNAASL